MKTVFKIIAASLSLILVLGAFFACELPSEGPIELHYDGDYSASFYYPASITTYTYAVRLTASMLDPHEGKSITGLKFYIRNPPMSLIMQVYGNGNTYSPGSSITSTTISLPELATNSWNQFDFTNPVTIPASGDLWIALYAAVDAGVQVFGTDAGPTYSNGDFVYSTSWGHLQLDRNLNLRAIVE